MKKVILTACFLLSLLSYTQAQESVNPDNSSQKKVETNILSTGATVNVVGEVSNEELFTSIINKFREKVVLVDFWATWCGPCRMANKAMLSLKEELKEKGITYVYITGESSPLDKWETMITDIHGEHFRLTDAQWKHLIKSFDIKGIPSYMLIDKEGNTVYRTTGFPGNETMKTELLKAVDKK